MYRYLGRYIDTSGLNNQYLTIESIIDGIDARVLPSCRCRCRNLSHRWHYHQVMIILSTMHRWLIPSLTPSTGHPWCDFTDFVPPLQYVATCIEEVPSEKNVQLHKDTKTHKTPTYLPVFGPKELDSQKTGTPSRTLLSACGLRRGRVSG
jgi:hypothetical protein